MSVQPPDAAIIDLILPDGDGVEVLPQHPRVERDADPRPLGRGRGGGEGARARGRRRRLRDQAVRPEGAGRPAARRRCGAPATTPTSRRSRPAGSRSTWPATRSRRDGEEIHLTPIEFELLGTLARNRGRLMTHRRSADGGLGTRLRGRHPDPAHPHRQPAAQDRAARRARATSAPIRASATASRAEAFTTSLCGGAESYTRLDGAGAML